MTFTDIAELKIRVLGQDALKTFDALNASAKDVKDQLKEMELEGKKNTEEYKALARVQRDLQQEIKKTTQGIDVQNASMRELEALMKRKNQELKILKVGSAEWIAKLKEIEPLRDRIAEINQQVRGLDTTTKAQEGSWTKYAGLVKAAFVIGAVIEFAKQIWDVGMQVFNLTAKFEKYETVLKNALGSQEKATAALKMLKEIAATTPFSLDEMTASFNKMVNRGLLPTSAEMKKLSDLAASQGKDFDQLTEAVLDAQMGEGERLKEFGIKMKKEGDNVSLSFKGQTTNVKNNEQAIYEAIVAMGEYNGVAGVTSEVSDKLSGKQSNLGDKIDFVTVQLGEKLKPVFHFILDLFVKGVGFVGDFIDKIGPLGVLVESVAEAFGGLWNIGKELFFKIFPQAQGQVFDMGKAVKILGTVLYATLVPFQLLRAAVVGLIDVYRVLGNATSMVGKALQGDFNGAKAEAKQLETSWNNLKKNGTENFGAISKGFNKIWTDSSADMKKTGKDWDSHVNDMKKGQKEMTANTEGEAKKRESAEKKAAKEVADAHKKMLKEIEKANEMADKTIRKSLADNMKAKIASNKAELDASEKLRKEQMDNALKMALFKDSLEKVERIKKAKSLKEIEEIEAEYKDKALKRELDYSRIFLERKEKEFKDLKKLRAFTKEEEDKRAKELLDLRQDVADKELAILKKSIADKQEELKDDKAVVDQMWEQEVEAYKKKEQDKADLKAQIIKQFGDEARRLTNEFLQNAIAYYQKEVDAADGAIKKFLAQQKLNSAKNTANVISGAMDIASGNYVAGSIKIVTGIVKFFDDEFNAYAKALEARAAATAERIKRNLDTLLPRLQATISGLEDIQAVYSKVGEDPFAGVVDSLTKLNEIYSTLLASHLSGIDKMTERHNNSALALVDAEVQIGEKIISNWELATDKQDELFQQKKSLIQQNYDDEILKINQKYDHEFIRLSQRFDAENLAITEGVNKDLMAFVQNQDLKLGLTTEYERRRGQIAANFALAYKPITEGMSEAEIKGINDAIKARDEAFAKLADWQTGQIQFVIANGKLERDTFTETQKIISDGKEAQYQLSLKYKADEIKNEIDRNAEKDAADAVRKASLIEAETNYNNTITAINLAKDEAIAASMGRLKNFMIAAIDSMQNRYAEMVANGIVGSEAFLASLNKIKDAYYDIFNTSLPGTNDSRGSSTPTPTVNPTPTNTPRFAAGTEYLDPKGIFPSGTDKVPIMADRGERIIDKHSNALLGGISNRDLVTMVLRSNLYRNGPNVSTTSGMVNLASPASVQQASSVTNNISTTALETAVAQMAKEIKAQSAYLAVIADKDPSINFHALSNAFKETADINARSSF